MQSMESMLRTVPGFTQLDGEVLERVAAHGDFAEAGPGEVLFREGTLPESLYVLLDGRVSLTGTTSDASRTVIDVLGPRCSFILANVLADEPYLMGAETVANSLLVKLPAEPLRAVVTAHPSAAIAMMRAMSAELGSMTQQVVDLKVRIAAQRLGTYLLSLVPDPNVTRAEFRLPISKGLLGPWLGCRAENLSRAFTALRAFGVETHGSRVMLHDIPQLRSYAGASGLAQPGDGGPVGQAPVEQIFGDAFRLRPWHRRKN
jgi:CRP/FNR family transcriptional regulator, transcriptional activator FtrB